MIDDGEDHRTAGRGRCLFRQAPNRREPEGDFHGLGKVRPSDGPDDIAEQAFYDVIQHCKWQDKLLPDWLERIQKIQGERLMTERCIQGKRTSETNWCDWNIPLHWGA